ncbi:MAG: hypothetical protein LBL59_02605 [Xanthomonadaceae bacterium]|nr:hypothetical protein [Xanthomonadaceae bacterium]
MTFRKRHRIIVTMAMAGCTVPLPGAPSGCALPLPAMEGRIALSGRYPARAGGPVEARPPGRLPRRQGRREVRFPGAVRAMTMPGGMPTVAS